VESLDGLPMGAGRHEQLGGDKQVLCLLLFDGFGFWVVLFDQLHPTYAAY
jgi:hypothetical protein